MRKLWFLAGIADAGRGVHRTANRRSRRRQLPGPRRRSRAAVTDHCAWRARLAMPIEPGDAANTVFGIAPFGYHGAEHAADGHPGWDIEYRIGGIVRAAAAGTVENVVPDSVTAGRFTVQIEHIVGTHHYRTSYTNLASVNADIAPAGSGARRPALGTAGTLGTLGTSGTVLTR